MFLLELVAVVFSFATVILCIHKKTIAWPVGLIGVIAYAILFYKVSLVSAMTLQVIFFFQGIYGWWYWSLRDENTEEKMPVRSLDWSTVVGVLWILVLFSFWIGAFSAMLTSAVHPFLDTGTSVLALVANLWLARKILESWILWIIADIFYIWLFIITGLYMSAALYVVFMFTATIGYRKWKREPYVTD